MTGQLWTPPDSGLNSDHVPLWNIAMSHLNVPIPLAGSGTSVRFSPIAAHQLIGSLHSLKTTEGQTLFVHNEAFPYRELLGIDFDLQALNGLPPALADAICTGSIEFMLHAFADTLTAGLTYHSRATDAALDKDELEWFAVVIDGLTEAPVLFSIGAEVVDVCAFIKARLIQTRPVFRTLHHKLAVRMHCLIGRATLRLDEVRNLGIGDFIVIDDTASEDLAIRCEDRTFYFQDAHEGWLCTAIHSLEKFRKTYAMDDNLDDLNDPSNLPIQDLHGETEPLPELAALVSTVLTFECGEARVTLDELESFQAGAIVPLPDQLTKNGVQVTVRAGEQPIAKGEIVQIDDRIGVRISNLLPNIS